MKRHNKIKLLVFFLVVSLLASLNLYTLSWSQDFKLFTDALDGFGGRTESDSFSVRIGSGGQPGVIGTSQSTNFYGLQGYVNTAAFEHGDANADGKVTIADVVYIINYLFKWGPDPIPYETGDVDCNNRTDIADAVYIVNYLFKRLAPPCNL